MIQRLCLLVFLFGFATSAWAQSDSKPVKHKKAAKQSSDYVIDSKPTTPPPWNQKNQGSEIFHQAASETFEATAILGFASLKFNYSAAGAPRTSAQSTGYVGALVGEYGFNENVALALRLGYSQIWSSVSPADIVPNAHSVGMFDPTISVKGRIPFESGTLRLGADLGISLGDRSEDQVVGNSNFYSGGISLQPNAGYEFYYDAHTFGVGLKEKFYMNDRKITVINGNSSTSGSLSGGNLFTALLFYEYAFYPMKIGFDFAAVYESSTDVASGGSGQYEGSDSHYDIGVYAPLELAADFTMIPKFDYVWWGGTGSTRVDTISGWSGEVAARLAF